MKFTLCDKTATSDVSHVETTDLVQWLQDNTHQTVDRVHDFLTNRKIKWALFTPMEMKTREEGAVLQDWQLKDGRFAYSRCRANVKFLHCLTLDVDNSSGRDTCTIEDAKKILSRYEYALYSSFNHLNRDKDGGVEKFRVLLPLEVPVTLGEIVERKEALKREFPFADPASFVPSQPFFFPMKHPQRELIITGHKGRKFDVLQFAPAVKATFVPSAVSTKAHADGETLVRTSKYGLTAAKDLFGLLNEGYENRVQAFKLDGPDKTPGCFIYRLGNGLLHVSEDTSVKTFIRCFHVEDREADLVFVKKTVEPDNITDVEPLEQVRPEKRQFQKPTPQEQRTKTVRAFVQRALHHSHAVLRTAEGYGKSFGLVSELLKQGKDVMFCCSSNAQANEKVQSFALFGAKRVWSLRGLIENELKIKPVEKPTSEPWEIPVLDIPATIEVVMEKHNLTEVEAKEVLDILSKEAADSTHSTAQLIVTTFHTGNRLLQMGTDRVIIVDDPSATDLLTFKCELGKDGFEVVAEREVSDTIFSAERFGVTVIWTTTERVTANIICAHHPETMMVDVEEHLETNKQVLIQPTWLVRRFTKVVLPGVHECVEENTKRSINLLMNGVGAELNLVSTKGRNDLRGDSTIVVSYPHPVPVREVALTLGVQDHEVVGQLVVDVLDQAIGRAQGYRECAARTLVLCDPRLLVTLISRSRYELTTLEGMQRRGRLNGCPLVWADDQPDWWSEWLGYLLTWQEWVTVIGGRVLNLLDLKGATLTKKHEQMIRQELVRPVERVKHFWKKHQETLPGDGRRNFSVNLSELIAEENRSRHGKHLSQVNAKRNAELNAGRTGKVRYTSPDGKQRKLCIPGTEPSGWVTKSRKVR